jgi:glutamyl-tRNA reductase
LRRSCSSAGYPFFAQPSEERSDAELCIYCSVAAGRTRKIIMDMQLKGKRALVTGSSSGIRAEIAGMLAAEGVKVVVHGRDQARTQAVATEIETASGQAATTFTGFSTA